MLSQMKAAMQESSSAAASHSFLLDDDSAIPFNHADVERLMDDQARPSSGCHCDVGLCPAVRPEIPTVPCRPQLSIPMYCAQDLLGETPVPKQLREQPSFAFLAKRLELALSAAGP